MKTYTLDSVLKEHGGYNICRDEDGRIRLRVLPERAEEIVKGDGEASLPKVLRTPRQAPMPTLIQQVHENVDNHIELLARTVVYGMGYPANRCKIIQHRGAYNRETVYYIGIAGDAVSRNQTAIACRTDPKYNLYKQPVTESNCDWIKDELKRLQELRGRDPYTDDQLTARAMLNILGVDPTAIEIVVQIKSSENFVFFFRRRKEA